MLCNTTLGFCFLYLESFVENNSKAKVIQSDFNFEMKVN